MIRNVAVQEMRRCCKSEYYLHTRVPRALAAITRHMTGPKQNVVFIIVGGLYTIVAMDIY